MKLILRDLEKKDIPFINKWRNDTDVIKFLGAPYRYINIETDEAWFVGYQGNRSNTIRLMIVDADNDEPIGAVYLLGIDWVARSAEFAIWVGESTATGKGAGYFATTHMLSHAFDDIGLNRIHLTVLEDNQRAINLYEKCGFQVEGLLRQAAYKQGTFKNMLQMSILADEYRKSRLSN